MNLLVESNKRYLRKIYATWPEGRSRIKRLLHQHKVGKIDDRRFVDRALKLGDVYLRDHAKFILVAVSAVSKSAV